MTRRLANLYWYRCERCRKTLLMVELMDGNSAPEGWWVHVDGDITHDYCSEECATVVAVQEQRRHTHQVSSFQASMTIGEALAMSDSDARLER